MTNAAIGLNSKYTPTSTLLDSFVSQPALAMKAYYEALRQKIFDIYNSEPISQRQLAKRFSVSLSFIQTLLKRHRTEGTIERKPHGGGKPPLLTPAQLEQLRKLLVHNNDATLKELCELLEQKTQVLVSCSTMGRILQVMNLTRKKNM